MLATAIARLHKTGSMPHNMTRPLSVTHFKPQSRVPLSAVPSAVRLSSLLAESCGRSLSRLCAVSWRVALDRIEETSFPPSDAFTRRVRFESSVGSITADLVLDRSAISAIMEAMMGGTGIESPFDMGERPLSSIETATLEAACSSVAGEIAQALSHHFGRPFSHFHEEEPPDPAAAAQERVIFRLVVNVFGYSGELRIGMPRSELRHQIESVDAESEDLQDSEGHQQLQRQVGKSDVEFVVTLGPEILSVERIASLQLGQMVTLSSTVTTPVTLWSGGVAAFEGSLARSGDRLAVRIISVVT